VPSSVGTPWEILYALDELVFNQRRAAYSDTAAARYSVPWISLVLDRDARLVRRTLLDLQNSEAFPETVFTVPISGTTTLVDAETAVARYTAALEWFDQHGHLIIGNGPFFLARYDPPAQFAELNAFRDPNYPFTAVDFYRGTPQLVEFSETNAPELAAGEPYEATITLTGPGTLGVRYLLVDPAAGEVVAQGEAESTGEGSFTVALTGEQTAELEEPLYRLVLAGYSDQMAQMAERTIDLEAGLFGLFGDEGGESEAAAAAEITETEETTDTAAISENEAITDTEASTSTTATTETAEITATDDLSASVATTETQEATETEGVTTTNEVTATEAVTEETEAEATAAEEPAATDTPAIAEAAAAAETAVESGGANTTLYVGIAAVAILAVGAFLFMRRRT
jgi:hypothetical protein